MHKPQTSTYHVPVTPQPGWEILAVEACGPMHRGRCCERGPSGLEPLWNGSRAETRQISHSQSSSWRGTICLGSDGACHHPDHRVRLPNKPGIKRLAVAADSLRTPLTMRQTVAASRSLSHNLQKTERRPQHFLSLSVLCRLLGL